MDGDGTLKVAEWIDGKAHELNYLRGHPSMITVSLPMPFIRPRRLVREFNESDYGWQDRSAR
jgi:hypothetical protein